MNSQGERAPEYLLRIIRHPEEGKMGLRCEAVGELDPKPEVPCKGHALELLRGLEGALTVGQYQVMSPPIPFLTPQGAGG